MGCCVLFDGVTRPWDSWRPADAVAAPLAPDSPVDLRTGYAEDNPVIHLQSCNHDVCVGCMRSYCHAALGDISMLLPVWKSNIGRVT